MAREILQTGLERPEELPRGLREYHQLLFLARACREQDSGEEARAILEGLSAEPWARDLIGVRFLGTNARHHLDEMVLRKTLEACGDAEVPRVALLERFRFMVEEFPGSRYRALARDHLRVLERMVAEDASHSCPPSGGEISSRERARDLIHHLREQDGMVGGSQFLAWESWEEDRPAEQLRDMGFSAVPFLVDILGDDRLTRNVRTGVARDLPRVCRYGDAAVAIISTIAGDPTIQQPEEARRWWRRVDNRAPFAYHLEGFRQGPRVFSHARRLLSYEPERALEVLIEETPARRSLVRGRLIYLLSEVEDPRVIPLFQDELGGAVTFEAARALAHQGHDGWVEPVSSRLETLARPRPPVSSFVSVRRRSAELWALLVREGGESGLERARAHYDQSGPLERLRMIRKFDHRHGLGIPAPSRRVVRMLLTVLSDETCLSSEIHPDDRAVGPSRLCDEAARILARRWETEEPFPVRGTLEERDRFIEELQEMAREQGVER